MNANNECAGNARALHQMSECESLIAEWGEVVGSEITAQACRRAGFEVSGEDVRATCMVFNAFRSRNVDVGGEGERVEQQSQKACDELLNFFTSEPASHCQ